MCITAYQRDTKSYHHLNPNPNSTTKQHVGQDSVHPVQSTRDLGVYVDGALTMRTHITHVLSSCYSALRQIRSIMPSLSSHALNALVTSLVDSRLDCCNVVFAGLPACDIQRLQSVLNTAVWWPTHRGVIMHSLCCATVIGCLSSSASSTNCA